MKSASSFFIALCLGCATASASSFTQAIDSITANNPEVIKARLDAAIAHADIKTAGALSDPELSGEYLWMPKGVDNRWNVGIEWSFEWFGVYGARRDEAQAQADAFSILAEATETEQRLTIVSALTEWQLQRRKLALLENMAATNIEMIRSARSQENGGQISKLDLNKLAIEAARFAVRIEDERLALLESIRTLSQLAGGRDVTSWLENVEDDFDVSTPLPSIETVIGNAGKLPAVRAAVAQMEAARRGVGVAKAEAGPGLTFGYSHQYEDGMHFNGASLAVTLPFFSNHGKKEAALARQVKAEFEAAAAERQAELTARTLWERAESLRSRLEPLRGVFDMTDNFTLLRQQYEEGQISLHEYQGDKLYFLEAELEYFDLQARYRIALADLSIYF